MASLSSQTHVNMNMNMNPMQATQLQFHHHNQHLHHNHHHQSLVPPPIDKPILTLVSNRFAKVKTVNYKVYSYQFYAIIYLKSLKNTNLYELFD